MPHPVPAVLVTLCPALPPPTVSQAWPLCPFAYTQDQPLARGIWATGQERWGQWARSEVWPYHSHVLHSWGFGTSKVIVC